MKTKTIRNLTIGEGKPKICVPLVGRTEKDLLQQAEKLTGFSVDLVEWRIDWFERAKEVDGVLRMAQELRNVLGELPLLATFRTAQEGGEQEIRVEEYTTINVALAQQKMVDLLDVEVYFEENAAKTIIEQAQEYGRLVIASNHHFDHTPRKEEIIQRLCYMQSLDADILKIAVMPQNRQDVLTLLAATLEMETYYADRPIITMSMAKDGMISRLCGEVFGSAVTFGAAEQVSAPGQIAVQDLEQVLGIIHRNL